jgi:site-specific DNA recombinase
MGGSDYMQPEFSRVGCYVRVSTENQIENYSIGEQTERLKAYCRAKGWSIYRFYPDPGCSGGNIDRPALQQMLRDIHSGLLDMVAVYKLDRLSRSQKDTLTLIEDEFIAHGVEFISISENFDTSSPFGRAMIGILSVFAQLEKDRITERFTMGRIGRSKAGFYHGGPTPPYGYDYVGGKLAVNDKAAQVKEAFNLFLGGHSINSIRRTLHQEYGWWHSATVTLGVLRNSTYTGKVKFLGKEYQGNQEPIISEETYRRAQELLNSPTREESKTSAQKTPFRAGYLLSSLVWCKRCGARYSANHGYYKCYSRAKSSPQFVRNPDCDNRNYKIEELDRMVISEIRNLNLDKDMLHSVLDSGKTTGEQNKKRIQKDIKVIDSQISRMIDLYQIGDIPMEQISKRISALQEKKKGLEEQLGSDNEKSREEARQRFLKALRQFDEVFRTGGLEEQRVTISTLIESVQVDGNDVEINWRV